MSDPDELFCGEECSCLQREGVEQDGKSFFDDAADQRRDRRSRHLSRDARRLTGNAIGLMLASGNSQRRVW